MDFKLKKANIKANFPTVTKPTGNILNSKSVFETVTEGLYNIQERIAEKTSLKYNDLSLADLESMYNLSMEAPLTTNNADIDLAQTAFKTLDGFNQNIKDTVNANGYGTREGVVSAGLSLIYDYTEATGKRLRYSQTLRQLSTTEGIENTEFYMDCSSFAWWALYNGGYQIPTYTNGDEVLAFTGSIIDWAKEQGYLQNVKEGQTGDFLIRRSDTEGHIVLILDKYDDGYYVAEFSSTDVGAIINKRDFTSLEENGYQVIDMTEFYNNKDNIRTDTDNISE